MAVRAAGFLYSGIFVLFALYAFGTWDLPVALAACAAFLAIEAFIWWLLWARRSR